PAPPARSVASSPPCFNPFSAPLRAPCQRRLGAPHWPRGVKAAKTAGRRMGISMGRFWWILPVLLLASLPAAARPRDDALAGAFRCAGIADSRQWLDCYYGAAQPVRAALKLAPALAAQVQLAQSPPGG